MAYEQRDNSGTLFKNDERKSDKHPHAKGKAMIGGRLYYISAWTKDGARGRFQSLSFTPADEAKGGQRRQQNNNSRDGSPFEGEAPSFENTNQSDIPF